jgi:hypothetical protein
MGRDSYIVVFCVPEPPPATVKALVRMRPVTKINAGAFVVGLKATSEYPLVVERIRRGLPAATCLTFCLMQADLDVPTVFPDGGADTSEAETIIEGDW